MTSSQPKESVVIQGDTISPNTSERYVHEFGQSAFITDVRINTYVAQQHDLHYKVYVYDEETESNNQLARYPGNNDYLAGENDTIELSVRKHVDAQQQLVIEIENVDPEFEYTASIDVSIDYDDTLIEQITSKFGGLI
jgi:hypothetical protein